MLQRRVHRGVAEGWRRELFLRFLDLKYLEWTFSDHDFSRGYLEFILLGFRCFGDICGYVFLSLPVSTPDGLPSSYIGRRGDSVMQGREDEKVKVFLYRDYICMYVVNSWISLTLE